MSRKEIVENKLTDRERMFVTSFILDRNVKFTSQRTGIPASACYNMLKKEKVRMEIEQKFTHIAEQCEISAEMVMNELKRIAFYDIKEHIEDIDDDPTSGEYGVKLKKFDEMDGRAIAEINEHIDQKTGLPVVRIKTHSKMEALKTLAEWIRGADTVNNTQVNININDMQGQSAQQVAENYQNIINGN